VTTTSTTLREDIQCCLPTSAGDAILDDCELLKPDECASAGGQDAGRGSCSPNPCPLTSSTTTTTLAGRCGDGIVQPELNEQCDPPWSRNPDQCPPLSGHRFGPECGDDCRCLAPPIVTSTSTTNTTEGPTTTTTTTSSCPGATAFYCVGNVPDSFCAGGIRVCDFPQHAGFGLCPAGMTCTMSETTCGCTGEAIPCGDPRLSGGATCNFCQLGTCPPGMRCGGVLNANGCYDCACQ
jgi:hypothetical protein